MEISVQPDRTTSTCAVIVKDAFQVSTLRAYERQVYWKTFCAIQSLYFIWKQNLKTDYNVRFLLLLPYSFLFTFFSILPVKFVEDVVFLCSLHWPWGVVTFTVLIRCGVVYRVAAGWGASNRCASVRAGVRASSCDWDWDWNWRRRRHVIRLLITHWITLLATRVIARRCTGWWAGYRAHRWSRLLVTSCKKQNAVSTPQCNPVKDI